MVVLTPLNGEHTTMINIIVFTGKIIIILDQNDPPINLLFHPVNNKTNLI